VTAPAKQRGRPRGFDRDEALESAIRLFWTRGYEATSISDLTQAMDITPPSLYAAFGDKKRLFLEAVERYEQDRYPVPAADAASIVRFLIKSQNLMQRDLISEFGSESAVSMFLSGQRKLTLDQVRRLSARFKLPADVFIERA